MLAVLTSPIFPYRPSRRKLNMRLFISAFALLGVVVLLAADADRARAQKDDKKDVVLKGRITCAKCELGTSGDCATVVVVKDDKKKDVVYFFDKKSNAKYHDDICTGGKAGTVVGTVKDVDQKKIVSVKKLTYE